MFDDRVFEANQRKHAAMMGDEVKILGIGLAADRFAELFAQANHASAHGVEFGFPLGAQVGVLKNGADDFRAMIWRLTGWAGSRR